MRTKAVLGLSDGVDVRMYLSGTAAINRPIELVTQFEGLGVLDEMGGFWTVAKRYCAAHKELVGRGRYAKEVWNMGGASNLEELNASMRSLFYIRREKADVLTELPPKQRQTIHLEIDNRGEYDRAEKELFEWIYENVERKALEEAMERAALEAVETAGAVTRAAAREAAREARNLANDAAGKAMAAEHLVKIETLKQICAKGKIEGVKSWVSDFLESGKKLVLFATHIEVQHALLDAFPGAARIFGEDNSTTRDANVQRFQNDPDCRLIVCSLGAAREGINLYAASDVAFVEFGWTPAGHEQAEDRCHRIGQTDSVTAYYFAGDGTVDDDIVALLAEKQQVVQACNEGGKNVEKVGIMAGIMAGIERRNKKAA